VTKQIGSNSNARAMNSGGFGSKMATNARQFVGA
jgi:hypothetical protein